MRIAIVTESYEPAENGVTASIRHLLTELGALGHEPVLIAPGRGPTTSAGHPVVRVRAVRAPATYRSLPIGLPHVRRVESVLREFQPDVVHVAAPVALGAAGLVAARRLGVPSVAAFQTDLGGVARHYGLGCCREPLWAWLRRVHSLADRTLAPSTAALIELRSRGFLRLGTWQRGVDLDEFSATRRDAGLRQELGSPDRVLVGYVGRLALDRRVDLLPPVAAVPGARLVVVGDGPAQTWLRRRIPSASHLSPRRGPELAAALASLDVLVVPSPDSAHGQTVQQALAAGVPVVAAGSEDPLGPVSHGRNGLLVAPDSARALALGVGAVVRDSELRAALTAHARPSVDDRSWRSATAALVGHLAAAATPAAAAPAEARLAA